MLLLFVHILSLRLCLYDIYLLVFGCDRRFMCDYHHDCMPSIYTDFVVADSFFALSAGLVVSSFCFVVVHLQMQQHNIIQTEVYYIQIPTPMSTEISSNILFRRS